MKWDWRSIFKLGACAFLLYLAIQYWPNVSRFLAALFHAAIPLAVGCVIAYLLNILASLYERHYFSESKHPATIKSRRPVCVAAAFITLLAIVAFMLALVVPQLIDCVQLLAADLQTLVSALPDRFAQVDIFPEELLNALSGLNWQEIIEKAIGLLTNGLGSVMNTILAVVSSVFSSIVTAFVSVVFAIYLLMGKERLGRQFDRLIARYLKKSWQGKLRHVLALSNNCFRRYIVGQCTEAVILGILCILGMLLLRLPYAVMIGTLIGFTALIPIAGAYIGAGVGAFMIFMVSPMRALAFLIFIVVLQQLEGNLIYPRVVGSSIGLPAIWVFAAVTIGGGFLPAPARRYSKRQRGPVKWSCASQSAPGNAAAVALPRRRMAMKYDLYELGIMAALVSFLGFILENLWLALTKGYIDNRNMNLPFLLGYGLAVIALYLAFGIPSEFSFLLPEGAETWRRVVLYFLCVMLCVSVGEILLGTATEKLCRIAYWNYSWIPLHITNYTSLPTSTGFAALVTFFMEHCFQPLMEAISGLDGRFLHLAAPVCIAALTTDYLYCYGRMMRTHSFYERWRRTVQKKPLRRFPI